MQNPELFASGVPPMAIKPGGGPYQVIEIYSREGWLLSASCSTFDPPRHSWVWALLKKFFPTSKVGGDGSFYQKDSGKTITWFSQGWQLRVCARLYFAVPLPTIVMAETLGVPSDMLPLIKRWSDAIVEPVITMITPQREIECAKLLVEMQHFFKDQLDQRKGWPGNDLLKIFANVSDDRGRPVALNDRLAIITIDLLASSNETTAAAIPSGMLKLVENPELVKQLRSNPRFLRAFSPGIACAGRPRRVMSNTSLGAV